MHLNGKRGITNHITYHKIHISYSEYFDSTLLFYYFYMSPLPTLAPTMAKGNTFSISSPFDVTKVQKKSLDVSTTGISTFPISMDTHIHIPYHPYCDGDSTFASNVIQKSIVSTLLSMIIFSGRPLPPTAYTDDIGTHKRHQGYINLYHPVQN